MPHTFDTLPPLSWPMRALRQTLLVGQRIKRRSNDVAADLWQRALGDDPAHPQPINSELVRTLCDLRILPSPGGQVAVDRLLHRALGRLETIQRHYVAGVWVGPFGPSWLAVYRHTHEVIPLLLGLGANPVSRAAPTSPCLFEWVMTHDHTDLIKDLLTRGVDPNQTTPQGEPWLLLGLNHLRRTLDQDAEAFGQKPPKNFKDLAILMEHPNATVFREGSRHHQMGCWLAIKLCVVSGANPWVIDSKGRTLLSHAMNESATQVEKVLQYLQLWNLNHPTEGAAAMPAYRSTINLATWLALPHPEFWVAHSQVQHFEILPILRRLSDSAGWLLGSEAIHDQDPAGRNFLHAWLSSSHLGSNEWAHLMRTDHAEDGLLPGLWKTCSQPDHAGNSLLHTVFSRQSAWDSATTHPKVIADIVDTLVARMATLNAPDTIGSDEVASRLFNRRNLAGETPHDRMVRTMAEENWPPQVAQAAATCMARHLATQRHEHAERQAERAASPPSRRRPRQRS